MMNQPSYQTTAKIRSGATLAEILVALGIMSIGVTLVASLFPATITQAVRATQLTNSTLTKHKAIEQVELHQNLIPDFDAIHNSTEPVGHVDVRVIDPLGRTHVDVTTANRFAEILRPDVSVTTFAQAAAIAMSNDSWVTDFADIAESSSTTSITFQNETASTNAIQTIQQMISATNPTPVRAFIETDDGRKAFARTVTGTSGTTVNFTKPLPAGLSVGNVRIQHFEQRYSWMITSRSKKQSGGLAPEQAGTKLVVFFRRDFSELSEIRYNVDPIDSTTFKIRWTGDKPLIRRGGHLLDPRQGFWYQIQDITNKDDDAKWVDVRLDQAPPTGTQRPGQFVIPNGIVQVYSYEFPVN